MPPEILWVICCSAAAVAGVFGGALTGSPALDPAATLFVFVCSGTTGAFSSPGSLSSGSCSIFFWHNFHSLSFGVQTWLRHITRMISHFAESPASFSLSAGSQDDTGFQPLVEKTGDSILNFPGYPGIDFDAAKIQLMHGLQINTPADHCVNFQINQLFNLG